jgi:hypothetical protein
MKQTCIYVGYIRCRHMYNSERERERERVSFLTRMSYILRMMFVTLLYLINIYTLLCCTLNWTVYKSSTWCVIYISVFGEHTEMKMLQFMKTSAWLKFTKHDSEWTAVNSWTCELLNTTVCIHCLLILLFL